MQSAPPFPPRGRCLAALGFLAAACAHHPTPPAPARADVPGPTRPAAVELRPSLPDPLPSAAEPGAPADGAALAALRADAEAVLRAQAESYWRLFTEGTLVDPGAAWRGREALLSDRSLAIVRAARDGGTEDKRAAAYLAAWLVGERLARDGAAALRDLARAREQVHLTWSDHDVPLRSVPSLLAGEKAPERRRALSAAAAAAAGELLPLAERSHERLAALSRDLGYPSPVALAAELRGAAMPALAALAEDALARSEATWQALLESLARTEGMSRGDVRVPDLPRLLRDQVPARLFPAGRHVTLGAKVLAGLGIDLARQPNLRLSPEPHPGTPPHSLALPIDPPGDVRLAVAPLAGLAAARAVLHELGAAEYYAHLHGGPMELRRLGPASVPQAWGLLLEEVAGAPAWLAAQNVPEPQARAEARTAAARRLLRVRERAARLLAALARAQDLRSGGEVALLARATGCPAQPADAVAWLAEPDPLLRTAEALRAELLAPQLEARLAREAGAPEWWSSPAAAAWLAGAWADAAGRTPDEISASLGEKALDAGALVKVVRERAGL